MPPARQPDRRRRPKYAALVGFVAVVGALLASLLLPSSASAHAHLLLSQPADGSLEATAPTSVQLQFSGTVVAGEGSVQVFAPDETMVQRGSPDPGKGARVSQSVDIEQEGTYAVAYRVSSEDGHVITGTFTFSVVSKSAGGGEAASEARDAASVDRSLAIAFSTARFLEVLALLVAAGSGLFACVVAPQWRPRLLVPAIVVLLLAYAASFVINAAIVRGSGIAGAFSVEALSGVADTPFGLSLEIRAIVAVVAIGPALLLRSSTNVGVAARAMLAIVFAALAASLSITGHAVTTEPTWLRMPLDMVHVVAAATWVGGLFQLAFLARFASTHVDAVMRFSRIAFGSVVVLLLTGVYATWAELGLEPSQLVDTTYGRLIVAKLALYVGTMPLAWNNMTAFAPQVRRRPDDAPQLLRQYVWRELSLLVVVVGLTIWLIATPQPG